MNRVRRSGSALTFSAGVTSSDSNRPSSGPAPAISSRSEGSSVRASAKASSRRAIPCQGLRLPANPIVNGALTDLKAGDTAPLKFSLHGAYGLNAVTGTTQQPIDCATRAQLAPSATVDGTLTYNASQDRYLFAWSTAKSWAGSCRAISIALNDGTSHRVDIRFTK